MIKKNLVKKERLEVYEPRTEKREFPRGKLGLVLCPSCNAAYYKKSWHRNLRNYKNLREDLPVKFAVCPACKMIKNKQFEGEIIIQNAPAKIQNELTNLIKSFSRRAYERDPMHRLIEIKNIGVNQRTNQRQSASTLRITVTENQLAVKLAKKIKEVFKKVNYKVSYSPSPSDVVYIKMEFLPS